MHFEKQMNTQLRDTLVNEPLLERADFAAAQQRPSTLSFDDVDGLIVRASVAPLSAADKAEKLGDSLTTLFQPLDSARNLRDLKNLHTLVNSLIETSIRTHRPLKEVRIVSHGAPGTIFFPSENFLSDTGAVAVRLNDANSLNEFARLRPYLAQGAKISFHGCEVASVSGQTSEIKVDGETALQDVADATGASVTAYKWNQSAVLPPIGPGVTKVGQMLGVDRAVFKPKQLAETMSREWVDSKQRIDAYLNPLANKIRPVSFYDSSY